MYTIHSISLRNSQERIECTNDYYPNIYNEHKNLFNDWECFKAQNMCKIYYSLSMCSYYPVFIFLCPKIESKNYPWKKTESLNYPNSIWEILAMSQIFSMFFKNLCFLLNENSRCLDFFTDTVWILENLHKFQLIIWDIAKISRIVF